MKLTWQSRVHYSVFPLRFCFTFGNVWDLKIMIWTANQFVLLLLGLCYVQFLAQHVNYIHNWFVREFLFSIQGSPLFFALLPDSISSPLEGGTKGGWWVRTFQLKYGFLCYTKNLLNTSVNKTKLETSLFTCRLIKPCTKPALKWRWPSCTKIKKHFFQDVSRMFSFVLPCLCREYCSCAD